jgi:arylsulfatase A-like enzyme
MRKDCLIVFSADNGGPPPGNNGPLRGFKGSLHEGGIRGCAFANWPGHIPAGQRLDEPTQICDWYPTLLKLAGADLNQDLPIDGHDLWPLLTQQAPSPHAHLIVAQSPQQAMIREGPWKLIQLSPRSSGPKAKTKKAKTGNKAQAHSSEPLQLYHLGEDPGETRNLISSQADLAKRLQQTLQRELAKAVPGGDRSPP